MSQYFEIKHFPLKLTMTVTFLHLSLFQRVSLLIIVIFIVEKRKTITFYNLLKLTIFEDKINLSGSRHGMTHVTDTECVKNCNH